MRSFDDLITILILAGIVGGTIALYGVLLHRGTTRFIATMIALRDKIDRSKRH